MSVRFIAASLLTLAAVTAAAEPATVAAPVNLRSGASTGSEIVGRIPAGSRVDISNCTDWCAVEWRGKTGFVVATAIDRSGRTPAHRTAPKLDLSTADIAPKGEVPMSGGAYQAPERRSGPYFWTYGPGYGPYKGTSGIGYRGTW